MRRTHSVVMSCIKAGRMSSLAMIFVLFFHARLLVKLNAAQRREAPCGKEDGILECGTIVACFLSKYKDEIPQIGKVVNISSVTPESIEIEWLLGSFSSTWQVCQQRQNGEIVPWRESVEQTDIIYFPIQLTNSYRLRKKTIVELKEAYSVTLVLVIIMVI